MAEVEEQVRVSTLSTSAMFALYYALAIVQPEPYEGLFQRMLATSERQARERGMHVVSENDKKMHLQKGLNELWQRKLIGLVKDGTGAMVPAAVFLEKLVLDNSNFVLGEGN